MKKLQMSDSNKMGGKQKIIEQTEILKEQFENTRSPRRNDTSSEDEGLVKIQTHFGNHPCVIPGSRQSKPGRNVYFPSPRPALIRMSSQDGGGGGGVKNPPRAHKTKPTRPISSRRSKKEGASVRSPKPISFHRRRPNLQAELRNPISLRLERSHLKPPPPRTRKN